jgi:hypothetical protein
MQASDSQNFVCPAGVSSGELMKNVWPAGEELRGGMATERCEQTN